jgi:hypothetical protein
MTPGPYSELMLLLRQPVFENTYWRDAIDELLVKIFLDAHASAPEEIVLDLDTNLSHGPRRILDRALCLLAYCCLTLFRLD